MKKKRISIIATVCMTLVIVINGLAYCTLDNYKSWVDGFLKIENPVSIQNEFQVDNVTMEVTEIHRIKDTITVSASFKNNQGVFPETFNNIGDFSIEVDRKEISLGTAGFSYNISSNRKDLDMALVFSLPEETIGKEVLFKAKYIKQEPLVDYVERDYSLETDFTLGLSDVKGGWEETITIPAEENNYTTCALEEPFVTDVSDMEYMFHDVIISELPLIIVNGEKTEMFSTSSYYSSQYGKKVEIEDSNGNRKEILGTIDNDNNLIICLEDGEDTKDIKQIYMDKKPLL